MIPTGSRVEWEQQIVDARELRKLTLESVDERFRASDIAAVALKELVMMQFESLREALRLETLRLDNLNVSNGHDGLLKIVTLRELLDARMTALQSSITSEREMRDAWVVSWDKQWAEFKGTLNGKLEGMNELRSQISTERGHYVQRSNFEDKIADIQKSALTSSATTATRIDTLKSDLTKRLEELALAKASLDGKTAILGIAGAAIVAIIVSLLSAGLLSMVRGSIAQVQAPAPVVYQIPATTVK